MINEEKLVEYINRLTNSLKSVEFTILEPSTSMLRVAISNNFEKLSIVASRHVFEHEFELRVWYSIVSSLATRILWSSGVQLVSYGLSFIAFILAIINTYAKPSTELSTFVHILALVSGASMLASGIYNYALSKRIEKRIDEIDRRMSVTMSSYVYAKQRFENLLRVLKELAKESRESGYITISGIGFAQYTVERNNHRVHVSLKILRS